jgi:predicted NBD/HSP70 family sugar kinase
MMKSAHTSRNAQSDASAITEQMRKRMGNRNRILRALHLQGPLQRTALARACSVRKSSVTSILDELIGVRLLCDVQPGRARSPVEINARQLSVLAASVTRDEMRIARVRLDGEIEDEERTPLSAQAIPGAILKTLEQSLRAALDRKPALGIGLALPGMVDARHGLGVYAANLHQWRDVPVRDHLAARLGIPVIIDNEIRCGFWASLWFERLLNSHQDIVYVTISEGVGGAVFMNDRMIHGSRFSAGELGHVRAGDEGRRCGCGKMDCLETYASLPAMLREVAELCPESSPVPDAEALSKIARTHPVAANVLDREMARLARVLAHVVAALDPSLILLGNQHRGFYETVRPMLEKHLHVELGAMPSGAIEIEIAQSQESAALKGAAALVIQDMFQREDLVALLKNL